MWHLKTTTVPVIIGALSMIKKGTNKHISKMPSSPSQIEIQKKSVFAELFISLREYN